MANPYLNQRAKQVPPHIALADLRAACGLTLDQVCARFAEATGHEITRGALSGIENGHRGASAEVLAGLESAYGLRAGALDTQYEPRARVAA